MIYVRIIYILQDSLQLAKSDQISKIILWINSYLSMALSKGLHESRCRFEELFVDRDQNRGFLLCPARNVLPSVVANTSAAWY